MMIRKMCPISKNYDIEHFITAEVVAIEEMMYFRKQQADETIELLIKRGVIYSEE